MVQAARPRPVRMDHERRRFSRCKTWPATTGLVCIALCDRGARMRPCGVLGERVRHIHLRVRPFHLWAARNDANSRDGSSRPIRARRRDPRWFARVHSAVTHAVVACPVLCDLALRWPVVPAARGSRYRTPSACAVLHVAHPKQERCREVLMVGRASTAFSHKQSHQCCRSCATQ